MKRFITYLYLYENSEKKHNVGFARMEIRGEQTRMELHIKAPALIDAVSSVYLFAREGDIIQAVPVGKLTFVKGVGDCRLQMANQEVGESPYGILDMKGIVIENRDQTYFISQWDEEEIRASNIRVYRPEEPEVKSVPEPEVKPVPEPEVKPVPEQEVKAAQKPEVKSVPEQEVKAAQEMEAELEPESEQAAAQTSYMSPENESKFAQPSSVEPSPSLYTAEIPMPRIIHGNFPREETLVEHYDKVRKAISQNSWVSGSDLEGVKIELKNIREMPKQYWSLGNNSFLLHGFFNYRYLVLGKRLVGGEEVMFMGVPGVYQNQERVMASIFGFPESVLMEKKSEAEQFGLWCHPMDE